MSLLSNFFRVFTAKQTVKSSNFMVNGLSPQYRNYADKSKPEVTSKQVVVQGATENEERVRVRRARPADVPRVLRFVREYAKTAWPGIIVPPSVSHIILCDYVARALSQGHSMVAEQSESRRGPSLIRGLALSTSLCPWDAMMLEKWAQCVRCPRSRRLMHITAHCMRAPGLHDKYRVHNILQVVLVVPQDIPKNIEIIQILAKNAIQRGHDVGFAVMRFDVTDEVMAKSLEDLQLKKEWHLTFELVPSILKDAYTDPAKPAYPARTAYAATKAKTESTAHATNTLNTASTSNTASTENVTSTGSATSTTNATSIANAPSTANATNATNSESIANTASATNTVNTLRAANTLGTTSTENTANTANIAEMNMTSKADPTTTEQNPRPVTKPKQSFDGKFITVYTAFPQDQRSI